MKNFTKIIFILVLSMGYVVSAFAGLSKVASTDLGTDKTSGTVRVVVMLTDQFVSSGTKSDVGFLLHQADVAPSWNNGIAISMLNYTTVDDKIQLKGYDGAASAWNDDDTLTVVRNQKVAIWITFDTEADTHSLSYQLEGQSAVTELYSGYQSRAFAKGGDNDFARYLTVTYNDNFTSSPECCEIIDTAKYVDAIEAYTFGEGSDIKSAEMIADIYPTIVNSEVMISSKSSIAAVSVISLNGMEMLNAYNTNTVDVSVLPMGAYLVKVTSVEGTSFVGRIIKK